MNRSQLPLTNEVRFCVSGTVNIHPTAAIATNVVLHANPGSSIEIGAGAVLGRGSIVHAHGGPLVLGAEVTLGTQILLFGHGTVGSHSCIGSMTTLMGRIQVAAGESIPPHTLQGAPEPVVESLSGAADVHAETNGSQNIDSQNIDSKNIDSQNIDSQSTSSQSTSSQSMSSQSTSAQSTSAQSTNSPKSAHLNDLNPQTIDTNSQNSTKRVSMDATDESAGEQVIDETATSFDVTDSSGAVDGFGVTDSTASNGLGDRASDDAEGRADDPSPGEPIEPEPPSPSVVYGQASVQRLISMMFPHRSQPLSENGKD